MGEEIFLTVFIMIAAAAVALQALAMFGIYKSIGKLQQEIEGIRADTKQRLDPLAQGLSEIVANSRDPLRTVTANLAEVSQILRDRTRNVDGLMDDLVDKTRLQVIRADQVVTSLLERVETTGATIQQTVLGPIQEVSAVIKGVRTAVEFLFARRRAAAVSDVPQDEQMFI